MGRLQSQEVRYMLSTQEMSDAVGGGVSRVCHKY